MSDEGLFCLGGISISIQSPFCSNKIWLQSSDYTHHGLVDTVQVDVLVTDILVLNFLLQISNLSQGDYLIRSQTVTK